MCVGKRGTVELECGEGMVDGAPHCETCVHSFQ